METPYDNFRSGLGQIEDLARRFLAHQWADASDIWNIEFDLLKMQIEFQRTIRDGRLQEQKLRKQIALLAKNKMDSWQAKIQAIQAEVRILHAHEKHTKVLYDISKRFGDGFAWILLGSRQRDILPLGENRPNPPCPTGDSLYGMLAVAELYSTAGIGFPILHDLTNCLRVGDITFVRPGKRPLTVEAKTHTFFKEKGVIKANLEISAVLDGDEHQEITDCLHRLPKDFALDAPTSVTRKTDAKQLVRQLHRMSFAKDVQSLKNNHFVTNPITSVQSIHLHLRAQVTHHSVVTELLERARVAGYATTSVEAAIFFAALRFEEPLIACENMVEMINAATQTFSQDVARSGIWLSDITMNCPLLICSVDYMTSRLAPGVPPLFAQPFPADIVIDLAVGRLMLITMVNVGRLADELSKSGFEVQFDPTKKNIQDILAVSKTFKSSNGKVRRAKVFNLKHQLLAIGQNFLSINGFIATVSELIHEPLDVLDRNG